MASTVFGMFSSMATVALSIGVAMGCDTPRGLLCATAIATLCLFVATLCSEAKEKTP